MRKVKVIKQTEEQGAVTFKRKKQQHLSTIMFIERNEKPEMQMTAFEKMERAKSGLGKNELNRLKERTDLDYEKLSKALAVTKATLIRKKGDQKYSPAISERMISLADIYSYGFTVFEDEEKFKNWMFRPVRALGGKTPYDVIDNQFGREEVRSLIGRIEQGVYS
ncbi:MAG TPA: antitoxin Xre/MbcA/ParS toxin-binding domain-containing protein [Bacteroidales bacterium]|nr:antitoxin Xre/MbcA/ParS toxin-binding domain-containing protein [Bacteroidales bacterium]